MLGALHVFLTFLTSPQVYGANTEVGKTVVTAGLLRAAARQVRVPSDEGCGMVRNSLTLHGDSSLF